MPSDRNWSVTVEESTLIWEFDEGMELSEFGESAWNRYVSLLDEHDVDSMVTCVRMDDPFGDETLAVWDRSAEKAVEEGVRRWAVVAEGIKQYSLLNQLDEPGLEVAVTDDREEALEWAREPTAEA